MAETSFATHNKLNNQQESKIIDGKVHMVPAVKQALDEGVRQDLSLLVMTMISEGCNCRLLWREPDLRGYLLQIRRLQATPF